MDGDINRALASVRTFDELKRFVEANPSETDPLEYKPLFTIGGCGQCAYCQIHNPREANERKQDLAREAVAFANGSGGWLVIGVVRTDPARNLHEVERNRCANTPGPYSPEAVTLRIQEYSTPRIAHSVPLALLSTDGQPAYIVRVDGSLRIHALVKDGEQRLVTRKEGVTRQMRVDEIELAVQVRQDLDLNRAIRQDVQHELLEFLRVLRGTPTSESSIQAEREKALSSREIRFAERAEERHEAIFETVRKYLLNLRAVDTAVRIPHEFSYVLRIVKPAGQTRHGQIAPAEASLFSYLDRFPDDYDANSQLSPIEDAIARSRSPSPGEIHRGLSREDVSYEQAFRDLGSHLGDPHLDEHAMKQSLGSLANDVMELSALALRVLRLYSKIESSFGEQAFSAWSVFDNE